ncbi:MAG: glycoside hydrolase [Candidatus Methylomirabilis sp.]|nr:glycoside hydrolase [Candidatus Methylomirabilis sp.]
MIRHDNRGHVWVAWLEQIIRPAGWQVLMNGSEDHGQTWRRRAVFLADSAQPPEIIRSAPMIRADGDGRLFVAWSEGRHGIVITRSVDGGRSWLPQPVRIGLP